MMFKITWRGVRQHPVRFLLSILAVVLGIAFVTGTFALRSMLSDTFHDIIDSSYTADAYVRGTVGDQTPDASQSFSTDSSGGRSKISMSLKDAITALPDVVRAEPDVSGTLVLVGADGTAVSGGGAPTIAMGLSPDDTALSVTDGTLPTQANQIALESSALEKSGLKVGDQTKVILNGKIEQVTVTAELHFDAAVSGATVVGLDMTSATAAFAPEGKVGQIAVFGKDGVSEQTLKNEVATALAGQNVTVDTGDTLRSEAKSAIDTGLGFISTFLLVFAAVALFVGGFIIANTFTMSVRQRMREIAVLRAVGASPTQVFASVVGQAAIIGAVGSGIGVVAGVGLVVALRGILASMGMELTSNIPLNTSTVVIALLTGIIVSVVSAAIPARRAARVAPVDAMRETVSTTDKRLRLRGILGGVLVALGIAGVLASTKATSNPGTLLGLGAVSLIVGALVWAPAIVPTVLRVLAWPVVRWGRPVGALARGNVVRNPRRTASTAGALMIGMALVGAAAVLAASAQATLSGVIDKSLKSDFIMQSAQDSIPVGAAESAAKVSGVRQLDTFWYSPVTVDGQDTAIGAVSEGVFSSAVDVDIVSGSIADFTGDKAVVQKSEATQKGWTVGTVLTLAAVHTSAGSAQERQVTVAAIIDSQLISTEVITTEAVYEDLIPTTERVLNAAFVEVAPGADAETVREGLATAVKPFLVVSVLDQEQFASSLSNQVQQILVVLYALVGLSIVIAILGIVNTLALSIMERTREIGLMRAVGLGRLQLSGVVVVESVLISVFGALAGLAVGVGVASAMPTAFASAGFDRLSIPWGSLTAMVVLAALVGVLAAVWPAVRAARMPVLESVTYD